MSPTPRPTTTPTATPTSTTPRSAAHVSAQQQLQKHYQLSKVTLGSGKFGEVRLGTCLQSGSRVAIKTVDKSRLSAKQRRTMHREVQIMQKISHPDIVGLLDHFEDSDELHMVLELVHGCDLFERITDRGRYNEKDTRTAMRSILRSVKYLHSSGICHRDIKPENFMTNPLTEEVKLIDFGLSKAMGQQASGMARPTLCRMSSRVGTPYYIAPEVLMGEEYDQSIDIWSVGVVFFIMLGGFAPFNGRTDREIFEQIKHGEVEFSSSAFDGVSTKAKALIKAMLNKKPSERPTAEEALQDPFFETLQPGVVEHPSLSAEKESDFASDPACTTSTTEAPNAAATSTSSINAQALESPVASINTSVFKLNFSVESTKEKKAEYPANIRDRLRRVGRLLWNTMEQAHSTQFGQLVPKRTIRTA